MQRFWVRPLRIFDDYKRAVENRVIKQPLWWSMIRRDKPMLTYTFSKENMSRKIAFREDIWRRDYYKLFPEERVLYPQTFTMQGYYAHHKRPVDKFFDKLRVLVDVHGMEYREAFRQCVKERMFDERVNEVERAVAEHQAIHMYGMQDKADFAKRMYEMAKIAGYRAARAKVLRRRFEKIKYLLEQFNQQGLKKLISKPVLDAMNIGSQDLMLYIKANPEDAVKFHPECFVDGESPTELLKHIKELYLTMFPDIKPDTVKEETSELVSAQDKYENEVKAFKEKVKELMPEDETFDEPAVDKEEQEEQDKLLKEITAVQEKFDQITKETIDSLESLKKLSEPVFDLANELTKAAAIETMDAEALQELVTKATKALQEKDKDAKVDSAALMNALNSLRGQKLTKAKLTEIIAKELKVSPEQLGLWDLDLSEDGVAAEVIDRLCADHSADDKPVSFPWVYADSFSALRDNVQTQRHKKQIERLKWRLGAALVEEYEAQKAEMNALAEDEQVTAAMHKLIEHAKKNEWPTEKLRLTQEALVGRVLERRMAERRAKSSGVPHHSLMEPPVFSDDAYAVARLVDEIMVRFGERTRTDGSKIAFGVDNIGPILEELANVVYNASRGRDSQFKLASLKFGAQQQELSAEERARKLILTKNPSEFTREDWEVINQANMQIAEDIKVTTGVDVTNPSLFAGLPPGERIRMLQQMLDGAPQSLIEELVKAPQYYHDFQSEAFGEFKRLLQERPQVYDYVKKAFSDGSKQVDPIDSLFQRLKSAGN